MRIFIIINRISELGFRQTTALLAAAFNRLDVQVVISAVDAMSVSSPGVAVQFSAKGIQLPKSCCTSEEVASAVATCSEESSFAVSKGDLVFIRTNPGRDSRQQLHNQFLHLAMIANDHGVSIINDPTKLAMFANKSSLALIDSSYRPPMLVTHCADEVVRFVGDAPGDCVLKPVAGSRGENVLRITKETADLRNTFDETFPNQQVIVQHFVKANHPGDRRVVVFDGEILEVPTGIAGIERRPAADDFRANLHAGGTAHPVSLTSDERDAARHAARFLMDNGIRLAGVDLIGNQIIELNVFSTGGLYDANRFASVDFAEIIATRFLQQH